MPATWMIGRGNSRDRGAPTQHWSVFHCAGRRSEGLRRKTFAEAVLYAVASYRQSYKRRFANGVAVQVFTTIVFAYEGNREIRAIGLTMTR